MVSEKTFTVHHGPPMKLYDPFKSPKIDDVPRQILFIREGLKMTRSQLAKTLGVTHATVSAWENGKYKPSAEAYLKLANLQHPANAMWCWEKVGLNVARVVAAVGFLLKQREVAPTEEQIAALPELEGGVFEIPEDLAVRILRVRPGEMRKLITDGHIKGRQLHPTGAYVVEYDSVGIYGLEKGLTKKRIFEALYSSKTSRQKREKRKLKGAKSR